MALHQTNRPSPACNDNGAFAALRGRRLVASGILSAAAATTGPICLSHVSDGVMIIGHHGDEPQPAARRTAH